jgi:hypothetical protein
MIAGSSGLSTQRLGKPGYLLDLADEVSALVLASFFDPESLGRESWDSESLDRESLDPESFPESPLAAESEPEDEVAEDFFA